MSPSDREIFEADRVALELVSHATSSAKKLGFRLSPEKALAIVRYSVWTYVPDPDFADLIIERARTLTVEMP